MVTKKNKIHFLMFAILLAAIVTIGIYLSIKYEYFQHSISLIEKSMSPLMFISLMILLPVFGFPISIFLIIGGIRFGIFYASLLWLLIIPIHALIGYYLSKLLREPLKGFSSQMGYQIPKIPKSNTAMFSFLFLVIPGIPYAGKNYLLPLAGIPFYYCVLMNSIVQGAIGIPFIVLGKSAVEMDLSLFYIALIILIVGYILLRWLKKQYANKIVGS